MKELIVMNDGREMSLPQVIVELLQRVDKLERENIELTNELYEVQNRVDQLTDPYKMTHQEAVAKGWEMTADGFWIKESPSKEDYWATRDAEAAYYESYLK